MKKNFVVAALIFCSPLCAQTALQQPDTASLDEVVVTAGKFPMKTSQTGKVVIVITRKDLEHSGGRDLAQVLNEQGGLFINGANATAGKDKSIYIRGGRVEHTLITIDGVPVYDASGIGSNFDIRNIAVENIERIEILKGSHGTLYGSDAIAGVINIITRKTAQKGVRFYGGASAGSFSTIKANAGLSGQHKKLSYNAGYAFFNIKGFSEAEQPKDSVVAFDKDGNEQHTVTAQLGIQATDVWRLQPYLRYTKSRGGYDLQGFVDAPNTYKNENTQAGIKNSLALKSATITLVYNYTNTNRQYKTAFDETGYKGGEHFAEGYVVYPVGVATITAGVDFRNAHTSLQSTSPYIKAIGKDSATQTQTGIYGAVNVALPGGFAIEGGSRFNHHSVYGSNAAFNINPSYLFNPQWKVFANLSSGYKTPGLYQLFSEYGNKGLGPETSVNTEGGLQYNTNNQKGSIRAVYFQRTVNNAIAFFFDDVTFASKYINQDKQKDKGLELDARFSPSKKFQAKAFYSYNNGTITTKAAGKDTSYFNLYRRPRHCFSLNLGSQLTNAFFISTNLQAAGNTKDITFDPPFYTQTELQLKNYLLVNLYAEYGFYQNKLKLFADLRNVTNTKYATIYGYNSPRFNAYGGFRVAF